MNSAPYPYPFTELGVLGFVVIVFFLLLTHISYLVQAVPQIGPACWFLTNTKCNENVSHWPTLAVSLPGSGLPYAFSPPTSVLAKMYAASVRSRAHCCPKLQEARIACCCRRVRVLAVSLLTFMFLYINFTVNC